MSNATKLYQIWVYLQTEPLFWLTLTIGAFLVADKIYKKYELFPLLNPVAISILLISSILVFFDLEYIRYFDGAKFIHFLLGPATVALAVPIFLNWNIVFKLRLAIMASVVLGSAFAVGITLAISYFVSLDLITTKSLLPRSVTAPIAMGIAEIIGGVPSLTAIITIVTGIFGAAFGTFILDLFKFKSMAARGFAFGLASHGIGTARAMSKNKDAGVFAAVAMGLSGIFTAALLPVLFFVFRDLLGLAGQ